MKCLSKVAQVSTQRSLSLHEEAEYTCWSQITMVVGILSSIFNHEPWATWLHDLFALTYLSIRWG